MVDLYPNVNPYCKGDVLFYYIFSPSRLHVLHCTALCCASRCSEQFCSLALASHFIPYDFVTPAASPVLPANLLLIRRDSLHVYTVRTLLVHLCRSTSSILRVVQMTFLSVYIVCVCVCVLVSCPLACWFERSGNRLFFVGARVTHPSLSRAEGLRCCHADSTCVLPLFNESPTILQ